MKINKCVKNSWKEKGALLGRWRLRGWVGDAATPDSCQLSALLLVLRVAQRQCREMKRRDGAGRAGRSVAPQLCQR